MKFTPVALPDNVNVSKTHPLIELLWLVGGFVVLVGVLFLLLGITTDLAVSKTPIKIETWIGELGLNEFPGTENEALNNRLELLLEQLPSHSPLRRYQFHVHLADSDEVNAIALPGGNIVVFAGLLKEIQSENELAMVLAHELGHFAHRDHLRGLGRGLGVAVASVLLFGENSATSSVISNALLTFNRRYSQQQETAADQFGIDLLTKRYGHAGGAIDFFSRINTNDEQVSYLLATHPHPQARIAALHQRIKNRHYQMKALDPLHADLRKINTSEQIN